MSTEATNIPSTTGGAAAPHAERLSPIDISDIAPSWCDNIPTVSSPNSVNLANLYCHIQTASHVVKKVCHESICLHSRSFSNMCGGELFLINENEQKTGSFKVRGATYALYQVRDSAKKGSGVIAVSAGNHAQGVAYAATRLGLKSTIIMPECSPFLKRDATRDYGANVIVHGKKFDDTLAFAHTMMAEDPTLEFVHPFDSIPIIAGQGTLGLEILDHCPDVDVVLVPLGGGGLAAGVAVAIKTTHPDVKVYGIEAEGASKMKTSLERGQISSVENVNTVCDGIAVKTPGKITFELAQRMLDGVVTVSDLETTSTVFHLLQRSKTVCEPAGAVALAAAINNKLDLTGKKVACVLSGGNIDMSLLTRIIHQQLFAMNYQVHLRGRVLDNVDCLNRILDVVRDNSSVRLINIRHDRSLPTLPPNETELTFQLQVPSRQVAEDFVTHLATLGFNFKVLKPLAQ